MNAFASTLVPDHIVMSPQQAAAIRNNEKVFPIFEQKLSTDQEDLFCSTTTKLSMWLNSERAYYAEARPKIVNLLEIAQATVRRQKDGGNQNEPIHVAAYPPHLARWVNSYTALIRTVVRFSGMFSETDLQNRLQLLFQTGSIKYPSTDTSQILPIQHIVPTQQAVVPSKHQRARQQNQSQLAETPSIEPSTAIQTTPVYQDGRVTPPPSYTSRPPSATTMHPSSSSLASALGGQNAASSPDPSQLPSKSPIASVPVVPLPPATPSATPPIAVQTQIDKPMTPEAHPQSPIVLDSNPNLDQGPSHASPLPSPVPVHSSPALSAPSIAYISPPAILPTFPTPAQVLTATPSATPPIVQTQIDKPMTPEAQPQFPIVLDSNPNIVQGPSHASPLPSPVPVHNSPALSAPSIAYISPPAILPTFPTPSQVLAATPSATPPIVQTQIDKPMTPEAHPQFPIVLDSNPNIVQGPSHASPLRSPVPVHNLPQLPTPSIAYISPPAILPTFPTPSQVLTTFSRPRIPPIRIPSRPQSQIHLVQTTSTPSPAPAPALMPAPIPIPAASTQPAHAIPSTSFSPIPIPSSASASTSTTPAPAPTPAATKKKKMAISEDLALADLEWFKAKQQKKVLEGASKASKSSTVTPAPAASIAGQEVKVTSVPEDRMDSDALWLEMKRKKGPGAAHKATARENGEGRVASSSATVEPGEVVEHPGSAGTVPIPEFDLMSTVKDSEHTSDIPVERTMDTVSSSSITNVSSSVLMSDDTSDTIAPSARNQTSSSPPDPIAPMDVDQPQSEPGAGVTASPMIERPSGDASSAVPAPSTSADPRTVEDVEMLPLDPASTSSELATRDSAVAEPLMTTSTTLGSAPVTHQVDENAVMADNHINDKALTNQEPLPAGDVSGEQPIVNEEATFAENTEASMEVLPVASQSNHHPAAEGVYQDMQSLTLDNERNELPVIGETPVGGEVVTLDLAEKPETPHGTSMPPASSGGVASTSLQPALADNEVQTIPPSLTILESGTCSPSAGGSASVHDRPISVSTSMDISPAPEFRSNDPPPITRKRPHSSSLYTNPDQVQGSPDSLRVPLDTVTNEPTLQPMKQEGVSETDVLQFLNTVPLGSKTPVDNSFPKTIIAPTREPRRIDFGPEMVVIAARRGSSSGVPMTIQFKINDIQLSLISLWQRRDKTSDDVSESMCLSLACYLWADLLPEVQKTNGSLSLEKLLPVARCSWPTNGGLSMILKRGEDDWHLPLSPPFHESPENLVDVSRFAKLEENTIQILQHSDMSDFMFALHAHFPTRQQLEVVTRRRKKDLKWRDDLKHWSRQLDAPAPRVWSNLCIPTK